MSYLTKVFYAAFAVVVAGASAAHAAPRDAGDAIPNPFILTAPNHQEAGFDNLSGEKGLILIFVRSLDWCPYCVKQAKEWDARYQELLGKGYNVATVSYDSPATLRKARKKHGLTMPTYADRGSAMIMAFDILNPLFTIDDEKFYGIPDPTIYVINKKGVITHKFSGEGYRDRPKYEDVTKTLASRSAH